MEVSKELRHWRSRLDLWWSARRQAESAKRDRELAAGRTWNAQRASGQVAGWHQSPEDPPGIERWATGSGWSEHTRPSPIAARNPREAESRNLIAAGWITFAVGLLFWPVFLATFVIGIIVAARGIGGQGALLIVLSVLGPVISLIGLVALVTGGS